MWDRIFQTLDKDGNEQISSEELSTLDSDGAISHPRPPCPLPAGSARITTCRLAGDGGVDRDELLKQLGEMGFKTYKGETSFLDVLLRAAGDNDGDKKLSLDEINVQRQLSRQAAAEQERS